MVADEHDLHDCCDEEEEDVDDGNCEDGGVQAAIIVQVEKAVAFVTSPGITVAERCAHKARAGVCAVSCVVCDGGEAAAEQDVEDNREEGEEGDAAEAAGEDDGEDAIHGSSAGHALNCLLPLWDLNIVLGKASEEV